MAVNMRNITQQNIAVQELQRSMYNLGGYPVPPYASQGSTFFHDLSQGNHYHSEEEIQNQMANYQRYTGKAVPQEMKSRWLILLPTMPLTDPMRSHSTFYQIMNQKTYLRDS